MKVNVCAVCLAIAILCVVAPADAGEAQLRADVEFLAGEKLAGRMTGSEGEALAVDYITAQLKQLGAVPLPGIDGYSQPFDFTAIDHLPPGQIPNSDGTIVAAGDRVPAVRQDRHGVHRGVVAVQPVDQRVLGKVPDDQAVVETGRHRELAIGRHRDALDGTAMASQFGPRRHRRKREADSQREETPRDNSGRDFAACAIS